jgi:hypothetical protein
VTHVTIEMISILWIELPFDSVSLLACLTWVNQQATEEQS